MHKIIKKEKEKESAQELTADSFDAYKKIEGVASVAIAFVPGVLLQEIEN